MQRKGTIAQRAEFSSLLNIRTNKHTQTCRIAGLTYEAFDVSVENRVVVVAAGAQREKILRQQPKSPTKKRKEYNKED
jgi:hypothetical protein